jgi:hypothetical protein
MKKRAILWCGFGCVFAVITSSAIDLKQSKITQVVNDVQIVSAAGQTQKNAAVNDLFLMPDILRTGTASRAELVAADDTITRVGANTIFSFDPANRTIDLKQGSLLFHSPHGKGGGTIHTGSATASVLGTTLIVTTTPNGGMKVLDLEGKVEVKFLNGLRQKLDAGEMTFILPGGNRFAPIVIFRLDELTAHSLLVKGFNQPLSSLPLIDDQIEKQLSKIKSGRATDTGLLVGDSANPNQVEVLDPNTIQVTTTKNPPGVNAALASDATLNQSSLTAKPIPTPPNRIFTKTPFILPGNAFFAGTSFIGFAGRDISLNSPRDENGLAINLSPYANLREFDLVAAKNLTINGPVTFTGFSSPVSVYFSLVAGGQIIFAPGASVGAEVPNLIFSSAGALALNHDSVNNPIGNISLTSGSDISIANDSQVQAYGSLVINTAGNLAVSDSTLSGDSILFSPVGGTLTVDSSRLSLNHNALFSAGQAVTINNSVINTDPDSGRVSVNSQSGPVTLTGTSIQAQFLTVNSGDGILLDGTGATLNSHGANSTASFTAPNLITVNNADLSAFAILNLVANTVTINGVNLPKLTIVETLTGLANINNSERMGYFNIINSQWMGAPITSTSQITFSGPQGNTSGIYLTPIHP